MSRFEHPLVLVESGQDANPAFERALALAATELTLLHVAEPMPGDVYEVLSKSVRADMQAALNQDRDDAIRPLVQRAEARGLAVHTVLREGTAFVHVIVDAVAGGCSVVLKTAGDADRPGAGFGATDRHLLRKCPCPVWLVPPRAPQRHARILAAVDPDPNDEEQVALSRDILACALAVAHGEGATLDVVYAWRLFGESFLGRAWSSVSDPDAEHHMGQMMNRRGNALDALVDAVPNPGVALTPHLLRGTPAGVITGFLDEHAVDLLIMGTLGRTGVPGMLIGNTAERVLDDVRCAVLALKPRGFRSPVVHGP